MTPDHPIRDLLIAARAPGTIWALSAVEMGALMSEGCGRSVSTLRQYERVQWPLPSRPPADVLAWYEVSIMERLDEARREVDAAMLGGTYGRRDCMTLHAQLQAWATRLAGRDVLLLSSQQIATIWRARIDTAIAAHDARTGYYAQEAQP